MNDNSVQCDWVAENLMEGYERIGQKRAAISAFHRHVMFQYRLYQQNESDSLVLQVLLKHCSINNQKAGRLRPLKTQYFNAI